MEEESKKVPIIIGNAAPFRLVLRDSDNWSPTLEDINSRTYDYVKLHRLSTYIDVGIRPYSMGIGFDGSLILPATKEFHDKNKSLDIYNRTLGYLLIGGIYTEAVSPEDISVGAMTLDGYFKPYSNTSGAVAKFHHAAQTKHIGTLDSISLLSPQEISVSEYESAVEKGKSILSELPRFSSGILLNGATQYVKHEWPEALVSLWTSIEQVLSHIWNEEIIKKRNDSDNEITGRKKFLQDFRSWTSSTKIEMLYQLEFIDFEIYEQLNVARRTRNNFVHDGTKPTQEAAKSALDSLFNLISLVVSDFQNKDNLDSVSELIQNNSRGPLIPEKTSFSKDEVSHWLSMPPIPGDANWGDQEYEVIDELCLKEIEQ